MDPNRKFWNDQQKLLREALSQPAAHLRAIELFLIQHAAVHRAAMSGSDQWSFADEVWQGLSEPAVRQVPSGCEHSIAWFTWHSARIEDVTMNVLLAGSDQLLHQEGWFERIRLTLRDTGNLMSPEDAARLSAGVNVEALTAYRQAVGQRTREVVQRLQPGDFQRPVDPSRLQHLLDQGAVIPAAQDLLDYWGGLTFAGLLLMPPTRHNFVHLNEALKVKTKLR